MKLLFKDAVFAAPQQGGCGGAYSNSGQEGPWLTFQLLVKPWSLYIFTFADHYNILLATPVKYQFLTTPTPKAHSSICISVQSQVP